MTTLYIVRVGRGWLSYSRGDRRVTQDASKAESWASLENATHAAQRWTEIHGVEASAQLLEF